MRPPTIIRIKQSRNGKWYYVPVAKNGEPGDRSQMYGKKWSAKRGAARWHPGVPIEA
jgi:uncharacterized protein YegP (UPF0339 family)